MENSEKKHCGYCGNKVDDITKVCPTCGNYANSSMAYCYSCGRENVEEYRICAGCKTQLGAKQNTAVSILLSFFMLFPFLALYAGRKKEAIIRIVMALLGIALFSISTVFEDSESTMAAIQFVGGCLFVYLFGWSCIDIVRLFMGWPKPYTNGKGQIIF